MLRGKELSKLPCIDNAYMVIDDEHIAAFGTMKDFAFRVKDFSYHVSASGKFILPSWCDSHTHLVFAGSRENEFVDKIRGLSYADIAAKGGGILNSARLLNDTSEDELFRQSYARLHELIRLGTGAIEIKSGYGLTVDGERKMLRVIRRLKRFSNIPIKATFLGAHTIPTEYRENHEGYIRLVIDEMLPAIANEKLADFIDVFCEEGFFTPEETDKYLQCRKSCWTKTKDPCEPTSCFGWRAGRH